MPQTCNPGTASSIRLMRVLPVMTLLLALGAWLPAAEHSVPLIDLGGIIACQGTIDGRSGLLVIDTGASGSCLFPAQVRAHHYRYRRVNLASYTASGPSRIDRVARKATIGVGGTTFTATDLPVLPGADAPEALGLLGGDFLRTLHAEIDFAHHRLVLHPPTSKQ
jgi:predicted aspartyl protease